MNLLNHSRLAELEESVQAKVQDEEIIADVQSSISKVEESIVQKDTGENIVLENVVEEKNLISNAEFETEIHEKDEEIIINDQESTKYDNDDSLRSKTPTVNKVNTLTEEPKDAEEVTLVIHQAEESKEDSVKVKV